MGTPFVVGGPTDNTSTGAAWVFTQSGGIWTQQGSKLVGTGATGPAGQGWSVGLSADGNTLIVGAPNDNANAGAAWVFVRSGGVWTQQGSKLVGTGAVGPAYQGTSVALSANGTVAVVGGPNDNDGAGAVWAFTQSGGVWSQQGSKLVGSSANGPAAQGTSVALSNSNSLIVGGPNDNANLDAGAAWVFTQSGGVWSQQSKLTSVNCAGRAGTAVAVSQDGNTAFVVGPDSTAFLPFAGACVFVQSSGTWSLYSMFGSNPYYTGNSVALSGDGKTAILGGLASQVALVFTQNAGVWTQQRTPLVSSGSGEFGWSVALSADAKTAVVGAPADNSAMGATWPFMLHNPAATHDFNGDGKSDILWQDTGGDIAMWLMNGGAVSQSAGLGTVTSIFSVVGQHDLESNGNADILWRANSGNVSMWLMNGISVSSTAAVGNVPTNWTIYGTGDLNGDFVGDVLWRDSVSGAVSVWFMKGAQVSSAAPLGTVPSDWNIIGDDNNGKIFWRDAAGDVSIWQVSPSHTVTRIALGNVSSNFAVQGLGDFNGDGHTDILWRDTNTGTLSIWFLNGTQVTSSATIGILASNWNVAQIGDYDGDGKSDILFLDSSGDVAMWLMNGATVSSSVGIGNVGTTWQVQNVNAN